MERAKIVSVEGECKNMLLVCEKSRNIIDFLYVKEFNNSFRKDQYKKYPKQLKF